MFTYHQQSAHINDLTGSLVGTCYSGNGPGLNNPDAQGLHDVGPIPRGLYVINAPVDTETHGPYVLWLTPSPENDMMGREAFGIHGDNQHMNFSASKGCIIAPHSVRQRIWESGDHLLEVIT